MDHDQIPFIVDRSLSEALSSEEVAAIATALWLVVSADRSHSSWLSNGRIEGVSKRFSELV